MIITLSQLKSSYDNATSKNGLIDFTKKVRGPDNKNTGKCSITLKRLEQLFSSNVWEAIPMKGGHLKFKHIVAQTVIEYKNHDLASGIDPGAVMTILDSVEETLNKLGNEFFGYTTCNWKEEPNYDDALCRVNKDALCKVNKDALRKVNKDALRKVNKDALCRVNKTV